MQVLDPASGKYVPFLNSLPARVFCDFARPAMDGIFRVPERKSLEEQTDGTEPTQLTTSPAYMMQWSRSGKSLAYSDGYKIYIISADGGAPEKLIAAAAIVKVSLAGCRTTVPSLSAITIRRSRTMKVFV